MKKIYAYKYGKNLISYDYIIIEKKGFDKPKIIQHGSCIESSFNKRVINSFRNVHVYNRRKDYTETVNILKTLVDSDFQRKEVK